MLKTETPDAEELRTVEPVYTWTGTRSRGRLRTPATERLQTGQRAPQGDVPPT